MYLLACAPATGDGVHEDEGTDVLTEANVSAELVGAAVAAATRFGGGGGGDLIFRPLFGVDA